MILNLFSFKGRASRAEFWTIHLVAMALQALAIIYLMLQSPALAKYYQNGSISLQVFNARNFIDSISINRTTMLTIFLAPLVLQVAVAVRRLHDRDKPGAWVVAMLLPIFLALFLGDFRPEVARPSEIDILAIASAAWYFSDLGVLDGSPGANSYAASRKPVDKATVVLYDVPPTESQRSNRNAEEAMDRAINERRAVAGAATGDAAPAFKDRRQGQPDNRANPVERRTGGDRRQRGQGGQFGRRSG